VSSKARDEEDERDERDEEEAEAVAVAVGTTAARVPFFGFRSTSKPSYFLGTARFARAGRIDMVLLVS
jgi:hypothetical protein